MVAVVEAVSVSATLRHDLEFPSPNVCGPETDEELPEASISFSRVLLRQQRGTGNLSVANILITNVEQFLSADRYVRGECQLTWPISQSGSCFLSN